MSFEEWVTRGVGLYRHSKKWCGEPRTFCESSELLQKSKSDLREKRARVTLSSQKRTRTARVSFGVAPSGDVPKCRYVCLVCRIQYQRLHLTCRMGFQISNRLPFLSRLSNIRRETRPGKRKRFSLSLSLAPLRRKGFASGRAPAEGRGARREGLVLIAASQVDILLRFLRILLRLVFGE